MTSRVERWKESAKRLAIDVQTLYLASRDPRTPRRAKILLGLVLAYALSPIDLIPDFIPILGLVDDLVIVPAGLAIARRSIPDQVWEEARARVTEGTAFTGKEKWLGAALVVTVWLLALYLVLKLLRIL